MKFEGLDTQEQARELTGCDVYFPRELADSGDGPLSWSALAGFEIIDDLSGKSVGRIASVDDSTLNTLFELEDGRLIPVSEELITRFDKDNRTIIIDLPEGILEL